MLACRGLQINPSNLKSGDAMSQFQFVRDTLYDLRQSYGGPVTLVKVLSNDVDFRTGKRTVNTVEYKLRKAIKVESTQSSVLLNAIITQDSKYSGAIEVEKRFLIIDRLGLPRGASVSLSDKIIIDGKFYVIEKIINIDFKQGFLLVLTAIAGDDFAVAAGNSISFSGDTNAVIS